MTWQQQTVIRILMVIARLIAPSDWAEEIKGLGNHLTVRLPEVK